MPKIIISKLAILKTNPLLHSLPYPLNHQSIQFTNTTPPPHNHRKKVIKLKRKITHKIDIHTGNGYTYPSSIRSVASNNNRPLDSSPEKQTIASLAQSQRIQGFEGTLFGGEHQRRDRLLREQGGSVSITGGRRSKKPDAGH